MESARISISCNYGEDVWFVDDVYGGLYHIKKSDRNCMAECIVDRDTLYRNGRYLIADIVCDEEKVILVPQELIYPIFLYEKKTGLLSDRNLQGIDFKIAGALYDNEKLVFIPMYPSYPLISADTKTWELKSIKNTIINGEENAVIWGHGDKNSTYFIPVVASSSLIEIDDSLSDVYIHTLKDNEKMCCAYISDGIWVLPQNGDYIKHYDKEGNLIKKIDLKLNKSTINYVRIIVIEKYIFLLPQNGKDLIIYDIDSKETRYIEMADFQLKNIIDNEKREDLAYWSYIIDEQNLCFLPLSRKMMCFDLISGKSEFYDLFVCDTDDAMKYRKTELIKDMEDGIVHEKNVADLGLFLQLV